MKKALSIILSAVLLLAVIPIGTVNASAAEDDVIEIRTIAELYSINNNMSGNFKLMNDIDMTQDTAVGGDWDFMGNGWEPIGSDGVYGNTAFTGTFDGNGHKIIGMRIEVKTKPSGADTVYLGLFANNEGTIKNLGIDSTGKVNNGDYSGSICAYNSGTITNCYNEAEILSITYSGGICGYSYNGDYNNCYNTGYISSRNSSKDIYSYSVISGGICGYSEKSVFNNCYNTGRIYSSNSSNSTYAIVYLGGICGDSKSSVFNYCYNTGNISSSNSSSIPYVYSGGICGNSSCSINYCYNTGNISSSNSSSSQFVRLGGICGCLSSYSINNCYNTGNISSSTSNGEVYSGGIAGISNGSIIGCYNIGTATYGIKGAGKGNITNCYYLSTAGSSNTGAKALTKAQLQLEMCMPNFDFENIWVIDKDTEYKYPQLISNRQEVNNPESIILGDVNDDGYITVADATLVQQHTAELITLTGGALAAADTNKDGYITVGDATLIQKYAAEIIDHF